MLAAMTLGAHGVQIGSRFVASNESSAHEAFKNLVVSAQEGSTKLTLKELTPVRLLKNKFFNELMDLYKNNPTSDELKAHLGRGRAKKGMFEGDLDEGELEIGQIAAVIDDILPVSEIVKNLVKEFNSAAAEISNLTLE
jgi:enoyl-[acyl-carrier protein] reductase II